jgi:hypothetical protein
VPGPGRRDWRIGWPPSRWRRPVHPSPSGLERKTRPAEPRRSRRPEHWLDRELHQRREGRANLVVTGHPGGTEKSLANAHAPARVALLCPPPCKVAAEIPEATGSGFPGKSVTTEFTNPTRVLPRLTSRHRRHGTDARRRRRRHTRRLQRLTSRTSSQPGSSL